MQTKQSEATADASLNRRSFLRRTTAAIATVQVLPGYVLGLNGQTPPSRKLNIAGVGVGGMGRNNLKRCAETENIVALCDVDPNYAAKTFQDYPAAKTYTDFREMLDKQKDIEAVVIATPDHTHAVVAMACMKAGKHVYVQKPLAHSVNEVRAMTEAARKYKVVTQMGNQGRSGEGARLVLSLIHI
ncbi:MAG: Gfo/Idh/MocA family oxidoreductase, partial [Verrucomicrobiae bacterium]|nr:Gfo/Idh/MocA family oxidoreductase [Verrucomicrobiae bacterium]